MLRDHPALSLAARTAAVSIATLVGIAFLTMPIAASAQITTVRSNTFNVNGRPVQEIRLGNEPGASRTQLRMMVLTNGPMAGTTTLLTAVGDANALVDSAVPAPTFTPVIASGTVFSVGGGCTRGNQVDFPYINADRPLILRFIGGNATVITPFTGDSDRYDSAECTVSGDGTETYFMYTNRTASRLDVFRDRGGATDLEGALVAFGSIKTPFAGGLRPAISPIFGTNRTIAFLAMSTNGQSRWRQYNTATVTQEFNCLAGVQSPAPITFTIPRGARVVGQTAMGDFNGDGQFEVVTLQPSGRDGCTVAPAATPAGAVAGSFFNWSEMAAAVSPFTQLVAFFATQSTFRPPVGATSSVPGPHAGNGGSHAACAASNTEVKNAFVSVGVEASTTIKVAQTYDTTPRPPAPGQQYIFGASFEDPDPLLTAFCRFFAGG